MKALDASALLAQGLAAHRNGALDVAESSYRQLLAHNPTHIDAHQLLGVALLQRGHATEAEHELRQALALRPDDAAIHNNLGEALRRQGRQGEAQAQFEQALALNPKYVEACNNLALVLLASGQAELAVTYLRRANQLDPESLDTPCLLANALRATNRRAQAEAVLKEASAVHRAGSDATLLLCSLLLEDERIDEAEAQLNDALSAPHPKAPALAAAATVALARKDFTAASRYAYQAIESAQSSPLVSVACAGVLYDLGQAWAAQALLRQRVSELTLDAETLLLVTRVDLACDDLQSAHRHCLQLIEHRPNDANANFLLVQVLRKLERFDAALKQIERTQRLAPDAIELALAKADLWRQRGQSEHEKATLLEALKRFPQHSDLLSRLASVLMEQGELQTARSLLVDVVTREPTHMAAHQRLANAGTATREDEALVRALCDQLAANRLAPTAQATGHFAAAKMLDDLDEVNAAFFHYRRGNQLRHLQFRYDRQAFQRRMDEAIRAYTASRIQRQSALGHGTTLPIIIVGMPRSGTTLIEQVLASHPQAAGAGEIGVLSRLIPRAHTRLDEALDALDRNTVQQMAGSYLARLTRDVAPVGRISDKSPTNFHALGLASILMPNARIVHCRRDPIDNCLSLYFQDFDVGHEFSYSEQDIAHYYAGYLQIMSHWQQVLPQPMLQLDYESVVSDFESQCRKLLDFCELDWDPRCLAFNRTSRPVRTSSVWQVRQPLYSKSVSRWKRYGSDVTALRSALEEFGVPVASQSSSPGSTG